MWKIAFWQFTLFIVNNAENCTDSSSSQETRKLPQSADVIQIYVRAHNPYVGDDILSPLACSLLCAIIHREILLGRILIKGRLLCNHHQESVYFWNGCKHSYRDKRVRRRQRIPNYHLSHHYRQRLRFSCVIQVVIRSELTSSIGISEDRTLIVCVIFA